MKNIIKLIGISGALLLASCSKKLDKEPLGLIVDQTFYKTNEDMIQAVNAAYDPLSWESSNGTRVVFFNFFYGDIASDDAIAGGDGAEPRIVPIAEFFQSPQTNESFLQVWRKLYEGIYRANIVIEKAPDSKATESIKTRVAAEAKFLRAYYYFELVKMFGEVPLITKLESPENIIRPKASKATLYNQIETDLREAASVLPLRYSEVDLGRATKGAANGLLARVYLFQAKWQPLKEVTDDIIASNVYDLETVYATVHSTTTENGKESLFEIQATDILTASDAIERKNEGTFMNKYIGPRFQLSAGGFGVNAPSDELVNEFKTDSAKWGIGKMDPRFKATILSEGDSVMTDTGKVRITVYEGGKLMTAGVKHYCGKYVVDAIKGDQSNGPSNQRIIRYADVLLMAAEAAFRLGDEPKAREYVNKVRARVQMPEYTSAISIDDIWKERRLELAMESLRFFDLVRQGRAAELISKTAEGAKFRAGVNEVFPIPQAEIDLTNGVLTQNPGY